MYKINWGVIGTITWFLGLGIFCLYNGYKLPKDINFLGDALAGIVAPLAFLWLVLGYRQQGKQLEQNTKALEQQEKALQLQIEEMKESVKQQTLLTKLQTEQFEAINFSINPRLEIRDFKYIQKQEIVQIPRGDVVEQLILGERIEFSIKNIGSGSAHNLLIKRADKPENNVPHVSKIDKDQSHTVRFLISNSDAEILEKNKKYEIQFIIEFSNSYQRKFSTPKYVVVIERHIRNDNLIYKITHYSITHS